MNKVISREYVEKNYIHKDNLLDKIESYINKNYADQNECIKIIAENKNLAKCYERVYTEIQGEIEAYKNIIKLIMEETKDENNTTPVMQKQKEQSTDINK